MSIISTLDEIKLGFTISQSIIIEFLCPLIIKDLKVNFF